MRPRQTIMMTFPADSTRIASTWSPRLSTCSTGITIVRNDGIVTVRYTAIPNTYVATKTLSVQQQTTYKKSGRTQTRSIKKHRTLIPVVKLCDQSNQPNPNHSVEERLQVPNTVRVVPLKQRAHLYSWWRIEKRRVELKAVTNHVLC